MGIFAIAVMICAAAGFLIGAVTLRIARPFGHPSIGVAISVAVGMLMFCVLFEPIATWVQDASTITYIDIDPRRGESRLSRYGLPRGTTSDFCYHRYYAADGENTMADFSMSEPDFLDWMESQNRKVGTFSSDDGEFVHPVRQGKANEPLEVHRGYVFGIDLVSESSILTIVYDLDSHRVYLAQISY